MEYIKAENVRMTSNTPVCSILEYDIKDKDINIAVVILLSA